MHELHSFSSMRCNSASAVSGCIERNISIVILTLFQLVTFSTNVESVQPFEKTLTIGFSYVNARLGFDTEILLSNLIKKYYIKMNIDKSFQA